MKYVRWCEEIGVDDVADVGVKNASLVELYTELIPLGVNVPNGFAVTADAYRDTLTAATSGSRPSARMKRGLKNVAPPMPAPVATAAMTNETGHMYQ
jgi:phosphoenolpyruvate synthase/pyruvate phosphate dikinase